MGTFFVVGIEVTREAKIFSWTTACARFATTQHLRSRQLADADAKLGALIERVGPFAMQVKSTHSPFAALLEAILYQQLHANAAKAILGRLLAGFGDLHPQPEQLLAAPEDMLRAAGLSRSKLLSLRDLAAKTLDGTVPSLAAIRRLSDGRSSSG